MKKRKWLIVALAAVLFTAVIVVNAAAKSTYSMDDCVEDGSCCTDADVCDCG